MTLNAGEAQEPEEPKEPSAGDEFLHFVVGQDRAGLWVVTETHGLYGGIFCSKDAALRFAKFETADRRCDIGMSADRMEFMTRRPARR